MKWLQLQAQAQAQAPSRVAHVTAAAGTQTGPAAERFWKFVGTAVKRVYLLFAARPKRPPKPKLRPGLCSAHS